MGHHLSRPGHTLMADELFNAPPHQVLAGALLKGVFSDDQPLPERQYACAVHHGALKGGDRKVACQYHVIWLQPCLVIPDVRRVAGGRDV